jgi:hypothetical protein
VKQKVCVSCFLLLVAVCLGPVVASSAISLFLQPTRRLVSLCFTPLSTVDYTSVHSSDTVPRTPATKKPAGPTDLFILHRRCVHVPVSTEDADLIILPRIQVSFFAGRRIATLQYLPFRTALCPDQTRPYIRFVAATLRFFVSENNYITRLQTSPSSKAIVNLPVWSLTFPPFGLFPLNGDYRSTGRPDFV